MRAIRFVVAAVVMLVGSTAAAQGGGQGGMGGAQAQQRQNEMMFKGITLTAAQQAKIDSIQAAGRESMMAMMQAGGMQDPANREKITEMRRKQQADIRAVLTAEQQPIFDKNVAEMPQMGGRRPPNGR